MLHEYVLIYIEILNNRHRNSSPMIPSRQRPVVLVQTSFRCGWEIPAVYQSAQQNSSPVTINQVADFIGTYVVLTGDEYGFRCCTVAQFVEEMWKSASSSPLRILAESLMAVVGHETKLSSLFRLMSHPWKTTQQKTSSASNFKVTSMAVAT